MNRLTRAAAAAILAPLLALLPGCGGPGPEAAGGDGDAALEKVTYLTSFGNFGRDAYAWVAKDKGFFEEAGFDVQIKPGQGTGGVIAAVASGRAQFGPVDLTGGLLQMGSGQADGFVAVAAVQQRTMAAIAATGEEGISAPEELEGRRLADTPGSVVRSLFPVYARLAGVDASKVTWVNGDAQTLMGTLAGGSVDAIGQFVVGEPTVEAVTGKEAVMLPYGDVMPDLYGNVLITSARTAEQDPEAVKRFTAALLKGLEYSLDHPEEAAAVLERNVDATDPDAAAAELELMDEYVRPDGPGTAIGTLDAGRVAKSIALLEEADALPRGMTPERIVDFDLVPKS